MIRKIVVPQERTYVLELPEEFVGKEVEVLAFEVKEEVPSQKTVEKLEQELTGLTTNDPSFGPDRDEASNYSEPNKEIANMSREERIVYLKRTLAPYQVDLSNYKFDRDEANDYE